MQLLKVENDLNKNVHKCTDTGIVRVAMAIPLLFHFILELIKLLTPRNSSGNILFGI